MRGDCIMTGKNNATCKICGTPYYMCLSCKEFRRLYPYKLHTDTAEHFKIYQILQGYFTKVYTKDDAKARLQNVDLSDIDTFKDYVRDNIQDIIKEDKAVESSDDNRIDKSNKKATSKKKATATTDVKADD